MLRRRFSPIDSGRTCYSHNKYFKVAPLSLPNTNLPSEVCDSWSNQQPCIRSANNEQQMGLGEGYAGRTHVAPHTSGGGGNKIPSSSQVAVSSGGHVDRSGRGRKKRRLIDTDGGESGGNEDDGENGRIAVTAPAASDMPKFACPYFKHDPNRFASKLKCSAHEWRQIHRLKEHLFRVHALSPQCPRCWEMFDTEPLRDQHLQSDLPCPRNPTKPVFDGFDTEQGKQLKAKKRGDGGKTAAQRWKDIYLILFPETDSNMVPSPYHEGLALKTASMSLEPISSYSRREFPTFVSRELQSLFNTDFRDIESHLQPRVKEIILRLQPQFLTMYERSGPGHPRLALSPRGSAAVQAAVAAQVATQDTVEADENAIPQVDQELLDVDWMPSLFPDAWVDSVP